MHSTQQDWGQSRLTPSISLELLQRKVQVPPVASLCWALRTDNRTVQRCRAAAWCSLHSPHAACPGPRRRSPAMDQRGNRSSLPTAQLDGQGTREAAAQMQLW